MNIKNILLRGLIVSLLSSLTGCDYIEKIKIIDELTKQQEQQNEKIALLEKQQVNVINSTKMLATVIKSIKDQQDTFLFTEFNPTQTKYFILNNGSVGLAGRVISIEPADNGSVIHIALVNLLSVPVSNMGFYATWGGEKPSDTKAYAKWQ